MAGPTARGPIGAIARMGTRVRDMFTRSGGAEKVAHAAEEAVEHGGKAAVQAGAKGAMAKNVTRAATAGGITASITKVDRGLGRAFRGFSRVNQIAVYGGMAAGLFGALGRIPGIGKPFQIAEGAAQKPGEILKETTVRDLGSLGSKTLRRFGLGDVGERVEGIEQRVVTRASDVAGSVFGPLGEKLGEHGGGFLDRAGRRFEMGADRHFGRTAETLDAVISRSGESDEVRSVLEKAREALGDSPKGVDRDALHEALGQAREKLEGLPKGSVDRGTRRALNRGLGKITESVGVIDQRLGVASKVKGLPEAISSAPQKLADANLSSVALKGAAVTGTALMVTGTARGVSERISTLKMLYSDITGEEKVSTRKLLFSKKVPDIVKQARGQIMKEYGPRALLNFANTIATYTFMKNTSFKSMVGSFALMGASSLHASKAQSYDLLPMYEAMTHTPEAQPEHYAAFISAASKDARAAGGVESVLVQALATQYAEQGAKPGEILKEIQNGEFDDRALTLKNELIARQNDLLQKQEAARPGGAAAADQRQVVGPHTERLQQQLAASRQASPAAGSPAGQNSR